MMALSNCSSTSTGSNIAISPYLTIKTFFFLLSNSPRWLSILTAFNLGNLRIDCVWELENKTSGQTIFLFPLQFYGPLFHFLVSLVERSCWTLAIHDLNKSLLLSWCLGPVSQICYDVYVYRKARANTQLISTYRECREKNANKLEMPHFIIFKRNRFSFLKTRTLHVRGRG